MTRVASSQLLLLALWLAPGSPGHSAPLSLGEVTDAVLNLQLQSSKTRQQLSKFAASKAKLAATTDTTLSVSHDLGARYSSTATSRGSLVASPLAGAAYQSHALSVKKPLYDFGALQAQQGLLAAQESLVPLTLEEQDLNLRWTAAHYFLETRIEAATVQGLEAVKANADRRATTIAREYRQGLRSEADLVSSRADALRTQLSLARAEERLEAAVSDLEAQMGSRENLEPRIQPLEVYGPALWAKLFAKLDLHTREIPSGNLALLSAGKLHSNTSATDLRLASLQAERRVLQQRLSVSDASNLPRLDGEVGARLPGELLPFKPNVFAQVSLQWTLGDRAYQRYEREELLADLQILASEEEAVRRQQEIQCRETKLETARLLEGLSLLEQQKANLEHLSRLTRKKFFNGTASSLEVSAVDAELLASTSESLSFQSQIYRQLLAWAQVRGRFDIMTTILDAGEVKP